MRVCIGCSRVEYYTIRWNNYLEAISMTWPGARWHVPVRNPFQWKGRNEIARDLRKSDILTMLEFEGYIDRIQFMQYRQARIMKIPQYVFREGGFLKVTRAQRIKFWDEKRRYARLIAVGSKIQPGPAKLY